MRWRPSTTTSSAAATSGASAPTSGRSSCSRPASRSSTRRATSTSCGWAARARSRPTSRSPCGRCSTSCGRAASPSACSRRSGARATSRSARATSTSSRNWRGRTSRTSRRRASRRSSRPVRTASARWAIDYREFGFTAEVVHSASLRGAARRARWPCRAPGRVTFHDPCYLGRYAGVTEEPRELLARFGATVHEPARHGANPFCCGAGGGLLFEEHEEGRRISQERFEQLQRTGASTIVTACPFCSIMLKGAQASANTQVEFVDLMSFVGRQDEERRACGRLHGRERRARLAAVPPEARPGRGHRRGRRIR